MKKLDFNYNNLYVPYLMLNVACSGQRRRRLDQVITLLKITTRFVFSSLSTKPFGPFISSSMMLDPTGLSGSAFQTDVNLYAARPKMANPTTTGVRTIVILLLYMYKMNDQGSCPLFSALLASISVGPLLGAAASNNNYFRNLELRH